MDDGIVVLTRPSSTTLVLRHKRRIVCLNFEVDIMGETGINDIGGPFEWLVAIHHYWIG